jgi:hypothetical protein
LASALVSVPLKSTGYVDPFQSPARVVLKPVRYPLSEPNRLWKIGGIGKVIALQGCNNERLNIVTRMRQIEFIRIAVYRWQLHRHTASVSLADTSGVSPLVLT